MRESHMNWVKNNVTWWNKNIEVSTNDLLNILIVEDEPRTQEWVQKIIEEAFDQNKEKLNFILVDSVTTALNAVNNNEFNLITVDSDLEEWWSWYDFIDEYKRSHPELTNVITIFSATDNFVYYSSKELWVHAFHKWPCIEWWPERKPEYYEKFKTHIRKKLT